MAVNTSHYHMLNTTNHSGMYDKSKDNHSENHSNSVTQFSKNNKDEKYMDSVFPSSVRTAYK